MLNEPPLTEAKSPLAVFRMPPLTEANRPLISFRSATTNPQSWRSCAASPAHIMRARAVVRAVTSFFVIAHDQVAHPIGSVCGSQAIDNA